jgi:hypothetical protein
VLINTTTIFVGNATVNTVTTAGQISISGATVNSTIYTGTANNANNLGGSSLSTIQSQITGNAATAYTNAIAIAANATNITSGTLANARLSSQVVNTSGNFTVAGNINFTAANNFFSTRVSVGANAIINTTALYIGNGTVNTVINSSSIATGNDVVNVSISSTSIALGNTGSFTVGNTTVNTTISSAAIRIGNSTVNTVITSTSIDTDGALVVLGTATLSNTISVTGNATFSNTINVASDAEIGGNIIVRGNMTVNGSLTYATTSTSNGNFIPSSNNTFDIGSTTAVWRQGHFENIFVTTNVATANISVSNRSTFTGNATFSNTITVVGNATFSNTIAVTGNATFSNTIAVTGNATFSNTVSVTGVATFSSNAAINGSAVINSTVQHFANSYTFTNSAVAANIDVTAATTYRSCEYMVQMMDTTVSPNRHHITKLLVIHNGTTAYITEYGTLFTVSSLGTLDVIIGGGNIALQLTPATSNVVARFSRTSIA